MSEHDERAENGDGERVVVRDRRRIDPETGQVRTPDGADSAPAGASSMTSPSISLSTNDPGVSGM